MFLRGGRIFGNDVAHVLVYYASRTTATISNYLFQLLGARGFTILRWFADSYRSFLGDSDLDTMFYWRRRGYYDYVDILSSSPVTIVRTVFLYFQLLQLQYHFRSVKKITSAGPASWDLWNEPTLPLTSDARARLLYIVSTLLVYIGNSSLLTHTKQGNIPRERVGK